jgi:hypothetical protein
MCSVTLAGSQQEKSGSEHERRERHIKGDRSNAENPMKQEEAY